MGVDFIRDKVRMRDGNQCILCGHMGTKKRNLDVHHLDENLGGINGKKYRNNPIHRMITICHKCHMEHHNGYRKIKYQGKNVSKYIKHKLSLF